MRHRPLDHLLYAVPDLAAGMAALERRLGVRATPGGRHPQWGTHNALLALGDDAYLELIAPDPAAPATNLPVFHTLAAPRLWSWAVRATGLAAVVATAAGQGLRLGGVSAGQRRRADGHVLAWHLTDPAADREGGVVPFFIDWGTTPHPAATAPPGCSLHALHALHPDPARLRSVLDALGVSLAVAYGAAPALRATLATPNGLVRLG